MPSTTPLVTPPTGRPAIERWVEDNLGHLVADPVVASSAFVGGQSAADAALENFEVAGYAASRNEVLPEHARGASKLSPYIRHGLLQLQHVWDRVDGGPPRDVSKFRFELLWQEYARHWYATHGTVTRRGVRYRQAAPKPRTKPWPDEMLCVSTNLTELHEDGWVVNQARMWLASQWTVRHDAPWREGEDWFFRHLLDGSRAANRLGWQWTGGLSKQKVYGFSRRQVLRRAPDLCDRCELRDNCPITSWPEGPEREKASADAPGPTLVGPGKPDIRRKPEFVWITAESMGDADPAMRAHPELPVVFVFDEPLLKRLTLSSKRLVFLAESLADLSNRREVVVYLGGPEAIVSDLHPAVTFAPVPGFRTITERVPPAAVYPWPWLRRPDGGTVASFSQWNRRG